MGGIFGLIRLDDQSVDAADLERQAYGLGHAQRLGPKIWRDGPAGFGAITLKIRREDSFDSQPLYDRELIFVSNARLDNREAIADALSIGADSLRAMADSALLFAAYKAWGQACVDRLIGDFAFAAWDSGARALTLGRDHMGQRSIFFFKGERFFAFASERKGLLALPDVPRLLPETTIANALMQSANRTIYPAGADGIGAVPGGSLVTLDASGDLRCRRYWTPHADPIHENRDEAYYIETYRRVLSEAVACRVRGALAPAGVLMGGGFDTSAICALAGPIAAQQGQKFIVASSVMPEDYQGDIQHARKWVEMCHVHMPHLDVRYVTREGLDIFNGMEAGFLATDSGHSPNRYVNDALYATVAAAGGRIVMDGFGGDYTLNPRGQRFLITLLRRGRFRRFISEWRARRRFLRRSHWRLFKTAILPHLAPSLWRRWLRYRTGLAPFGPTMPVTPAYALKNRASATRHTAWRLGMRDAMRSALDGQQNAPSRAGAIAAAAHGLEFSQPFHDKRVVELALAIPEDLYVKNGRERHLAREALKDLYPPQYQTRGPSNDDLGPDFLMMAKRIEPRVLAEIARMEKTGKLSEIFDFPRMRKMLTRRRLDQHASGNEYDTRQAMLAFLWARYIEWFKNDNG